MRQEGGVATRYSDDEIRELLDEPKPLPDDHQARMQLRPKRGHKERSLTVQGTSGAEYLVILRQSSHNVLDFSVILAYCVPNSNALFRLRRYNGKSHQHTNRIEKQTFYDFHIHTATARYQDGGADEDGYAEVTDRYADLHGAVECLFEDCGFRSPDHAQQKLL